MINLTSMKIKALLLISVFAGLILFSSCGNETTSEDKTNSDSLKAKVPEELAKLNEQIAADPKNADLYHNRAKYYLNNRNFEAGFEDMRQVMTIDSFKAEYFITLSDLYFVTNQTGNSKSSLEKCLSLDDKNIDAMLKLAELYFYVKKHDKCFEYLNMALKIDKYNSKAYYMKGMNYKELKDTAKAISSMQTAVEQDQNYFTAYVQLGLLNAAQKNPIAINYYKNALKIKPNSPEVWYAVGKFYQDVENWDKAIETYNALLELDPKNKNANYNLGGIFMVGKKDYKKSLEYFTKALTIDPAYVDAYYGRGVCYQSMGDKKNAVIDFKTCLTINPQHEAATKALELVN